MGNLDSDFITEWAENIAREVAPDEFYQAPRIAEDFIKGGKARRKLFEETKGDVLGGLGGPALELLLPWVWQGLQVAAPFLYSVLASGTIPNIIELAEKVQAWKKERKLKREQGQLQEKQPQQPPLPTLPEPNTPSDELFDKSLVTLSREVEKSKQLQDQQSKPLQDISDEKAGQVIIVLCQNPAGAMALLQKLTERK